MKTCKPNLKEYQIESDFTKVCMDNACNQAYPAIVASGGMALSSITLKITLP